MCLLQLYLQKPGTVSWLCPRAAGLKKDVGFLSHYKKKIKSYCLQMDLEDIIFN